MNQSTLMLFDFTTRKWTQLARFRSIHHPVWSRDEMYLYFQAEEGRINRVRVRGLQSTKGLDAIGNWKNSVCYFEGLALDESPLVSCRQSDRDLYALDWEAP